MKKINVIFWHDYLNGWEEALEEDDRLRYNAVELPDGLWEQYQEALNKYSTLVEEIRHYVILKENK